MKQKQVHLLLKVIRRKKIRKAFHLFYQDVQIKKSSVCKEDVVVYCKDIRLTDEMIQESTFNKGLGNDIEKASMVSHFIHAYFNQYGVVVDTPFEKDGAYGFCILGAYRRWTRC